jgi:hypothetical protein
MDRTRRVALLACLIPPLVSHAREQDHDQNPEQDQRRRPFPPNPNEDTRLPNGKSQKDAIAKDNHEQALKESEDLVTAAQQLRDEIKRAGSYVVPVSSVKKTEEIEKLARRIRGRLKA